MNESTTDYICAFLNFIDSVNPSIEMAVADLNDANDQLCDIQHFIELGSYNAVTMVRLVKKEKSVREVRRIAKNTIDQLTPVSEWISENRVAVNKLRATLGQLRKKDSARMHRAYCVRTDVLSDFTDKTHLIDRNGADGVG